MSDTRNRDVGRKKQRKRDHPKWSCDCWYCQPGADKLRVIRRRAEAKYLKKEAVYDDT